LRCGYKLIVKLLFTPPDRGAGSVVDIEDNWLVDSIADTCKGLIGMETINIRAASIETKCFFFINMTIANLKMTLFEQPSNPTTNS